MPWVPDLFSARALARLEDQRRRDRLATVPLYAGVLTGETDALLGSFVGEPELHHPVRGRIKGERAFLAFVADTKAWLEESEVSVEDIDRIATERRAVGEAVLHVGGNGGPVDLPVAIATDRQPDLRIEELRIYHSTRPLTGRHANRPPVLQPDPELREPDVIGAYQRALAAGDLDAIVASFEPDGYARELAGGDYVHAGPEALWKFYRWLFSNGGGIPLEHCALTDDGGACALEYNVVRWARPSCCRRRPGSPCTSAAGAGRSPPPASTTTPTRRSAHPRSSPPGLPDRCRVTLRSASTRAKEKS